MFLADYGENRGKICGRKQKHPENCQHNCQHENKTPKNQHVKGVRSSGGSVAQPLAERVQEGCFTIESLCSLRSQRPFLPLPL